MDCLNLLIQTVNTLRSKGATSYASQLHGFIRKNAQELGDLGLDDMGLGGDEGGEEQTPETPQPEAVQTEVSPEQGEIQRTFFYIFQQWHRILDRELPHFDYFGEQNIDNLRHTLSNVHRALEQAMQSRTMQYNKEMAQTFDVQFEDIESRLKKSRQAEVNATKAKVDAALLYGTTKRLHEMFIRCCAEDGLFARAAQEFGVLMRVFAMMIQNISEDIARTDLTEVR